MRNLFETDLSRILPQELTLMARKFTASKTHLRPDPRFGSKLAGKFINCVMHNGKKSVAQRLFYDAMDLIQKRLPNEKPDRRLHPGGRERQADDRGPFQASRRCDLPGADAGEQEPAADAVDPLAVDGGREKKGRPMAVKLADELMAAYNREGAAITRRENVHRMADANKAFAHFAW